MKDQRKPWQKSAAGFKWAKCGTMLAETAKEHERLDGRKPATLTALRNRLDDYFGSPSDVRIMTAYAKASGLPKDSYEWTADQIFDCLYCLAWVKAWGRTAVDYVGIAHTPEVIEPELALCA